MASLLPLAQVESPGGPGAMVMLLVVFALMVCLGILALAVYGLWRMGGQETRESGRGSRIEDAVGKRATVYVAVPGGRSGAGKIQVNVRDETVEHLAVTSGEKLPSGSEIVVVRVISPTTVEVRPVLDPERSDDE